MTGPIFTFDMAGKLMVVLNDFTVTADLTGEFSPDVSVAGLREFKALCAQIVGRGCTAIGHG